MSGKQLILENVNALGPRTGVEIGNLINRFPDMNFLDGVADIYALVDDGKIILKDGTLYKK